MKQMKATTGKQSKEIRKGKKKKLRQEKKHD